MMEYLIILTVACGLIFIPIGTIIGYYFGRKSAYKTDTFSLSERDYHNVYPTDEDGKIWFKFEKLDDNT